MCKSFLLLFVVWTMYNMCILHVKLFFCVISTVFWKSVCLWFVILFLCCFCFVVVTAFICNFFILMTFCILVLPLQAYGSMECMHDRCVYSLILCWYLNYIWDFCLLGFCWLRPVTTAHQYQRIMQPSQWHSTSSEIQPHTNYNTHHSAAELQADVSENINFPIGPVLWD
jgi:hypothetical protein